LTDAEKYSTRETTSNSDNKKRRSEREQNTVNTINNVQSLVQLTKQSKPYLKDFTNRISGEGSITHRKKGEEEIKIAAVM
jgi:hypothetical protein